MTQTPQPPVHQLLVITGLSGSGKTVALHALEDLGFYCVDNLPAGLLPALYQQIHQFPERYGQLAVGIDARAGLDDLNRLPDILRDLPVTTRLVFVTADDAILIRRFSETRRRHPLAEDRTLARAIESERAMLDTLKQRADQVIDTSETNIHQLRRRMLNLVGNTGRAEISAVVLESFAFKHGVPRDADLVFDARCLPNPHWEPGLRGATGLEKPVRDYLEAEPMVERFLNDILGFLERWLPAWADDQRSHLTVSIGCTGGRHRSVYLVDELAQRLRSGGRRITTHHRELER